MGLLTKFLSGANNRLLAFPDENLHSRKGQSVSATLDTDFTLVSYGQNQAAIDLFNSSTGDGSAQSAQNLLNAGGYAIDTTSN